MSLYSDGYDVSQGTFYPQYSVISGITLGQTTIVTFANAHDFTAGEIVSFRVSPPFGTTELNNASCRVLSITEFTITVDIVSQNFTPFVNAGLYEESWAMVVPSGSGILPNIYPRTINLEDAFDHKPPA